MIRLLTVSIAVVMSVGGCGSGLNERPLPFTRGNDDGALTVTVDMKNAVNLVPNSEVKVNDVTVGSVRKIEFRDWHARLTVGLEQGVNLPGNAVARIGQKSLLGAEYLELAPPTAEEPQGTLDDGANIPLTRSGRYPETEELFAALSTVLNGGGLSQVATITTELNQALSGRESDVRDLVKELNILIGTLDDQRDEIVTAMEALNQLSGTFARQRPQMVRALETLPEAVDVLRSERKKLTRTLTNVSEFGDRTTTLMKANQTTLDQNLDQLRPVLKELANAGTALTNFLADATYPFPLEGLLKSVKGDYLNLFLTVDITTKAISRDLLAGLSPLDAVFGGLTGTPPSQTSTDAVDPFDLSKSLDKLLKRPRTPAPEPTPPESSGSSGLRGLLDGLTRGPS